MAILVVILLIVVIVAVILLMGDDEGTDTPSPDVTVSMVDYARALGGSFLG